jgi:hypothetical protein
MKLQIIRPEQDSIGGFNVVQIPQPNSLELTSVVDNSCEVILAPDVMDSFAPAGVGKLCEGLVSKLRLGGEITLGGTDVRFFCKLAANGVISDSDACRIVNSIYSMSTSDMVVEALKSLGLSIVSVHMDGLHYEVKAVRG